MIGLNHVDSRLLLAESLAAGLRDCDISNSALLEFVEDRTAAAPDELAGDTMRQEHVHRLLGTLGSRDRAMIELRYGLQGGRPWSVQEVGQRFGLSRERIRQIEATILTRLRGRHEVEGLLDLLD